MSKIGKLPVTIPAGVTVTVNPGEIIVKGPKGELKQAVNNRVTLEVADGSLTVKPVDESKAAGILVDIMYPDVCWIQCDITIAGELGTVYMTDINKTNIGNAIIEYFKTLSIGDDVRISQIMRYSLNPSLETTVESEIKVLEEYFRIMKIRFPQKFIRKNKLLKNMKIFYCLIMLCSLLLVNI